MSLSVLVVGGGEPITTRELSWLAKTWGSPTPDSASRFTIAADSGIDRACEAGIDLDLAIGDFDSVSGQGYLRAETSGVELIRHFQNKDETDLELALDHAASMKPSSVTVVGVGGGRTDHLLASIFCLAAESLADVEVDALVGDQRLIVVRGHRVIAGPVGSLVSLIPIGGAAAGVSTSGLAYPLVDEVLLATRSRGLSNVMTAPLAVVQVESGVLIAIQDLPS